MKGTIKSQMELMDGWVAKPMKGNEFLERIGREVEFGRIEKELGKMYESGMGRPSNPPLMMFKMVLLEFFYNLSDPQVEEQVNDRLSFRRFVGLGLGERAPDETSMVRFRKRMLEYGLERKLLERVNSQLEAKGLLVKKATIIDATLVEAATSKPRQGEKGEDEDASYTSKGGKAYYGYKAHVASDADGGFIRKAGLTTASVHDSQMFEAVLPEEQDYVFADKAYTSRERDESLAERGMASAIAYKGYRNRPLTERQRQANRSFAHVRSRIERIFGHWKRCLGYRRVRYLGLWKNELELQFRCIAYNLRRMFSLLPA